MKRFLPLLTLLVANCASTPAPHIGGCSHSHELRPLNLNADEKALLESVSQQPHSALDYYMLLPKRYFSIMPSDAQRKISYVEHETMNKDYISARRWFECDGGGFEVAMRVFRRPSGDLIAIESSEDSVISLFMRDGNQSGLNSVALKKPTFWHYTDKWNQVDSNILPSLGLDEILDRYKYKYKADQKDADQQKFIHLDYRLLPEGDIIPVIGRENFMDSAPTWAEYQLTGSHFRKK
jgi:hypothetical protein